MRKLKIKSGAKTRFRVTGSVLQDSALLRPVRIVTTTALNGAALGASR